MRWWLVTEWHPHACRGISWAQKLKVNMAVVPGTAGVYYLERSSTGQADVALSFGEQSIATRTKLKVGLFPLTIRHAETIDHSTLARRLIGVKTLQAQVS